jgi:alkaline phosphatase D
MIDSTTPACSGGGTNHLATRYLRAVGSDSGQGTTRRAALTRAAAGAGALALGVTQVAEAKHHRHRHRPKAKILAGGAFASGVAAGYPEPAGVLLWTRLDGVESGGRVALEVASDPGFAHVLDRRTVLVDPQSDFTARYQFRSRRLAPGQEYFYRFSTRTADSPAGRFRTARPADSREPVRIAFFSCQAYQSGYYVAHRALAQEPDLDLVVCLGDYVYELSSDHGPRTDTVGDAQTLDEYRAKYRLYQSDTDLQAMHAAHPFLPIWDDHEVESSYYGETPGNGQGQLDRVPFPQRRANGYRAWFEHLPVRRFSDQPDRIYRNLALGANAELFLTDLHQYADPPPDCGATPTAGPILLGPCPDAAAPGRTLLGPQQRRFLEDGLVQSQATWKLWGSSMMLMALDSAPRTPFTVGEWSGWEAERNDLAAALHRRGAQNIAAFSGDIHTFFAGTWTTTGRIDGDPVATEFVCGSVTSHGIAEGLAANGVPPDQAALLADRLPALNPHLAYAETRHHGYGVATATPDELRVEFRAPTSTEDPHSGVQTLQRFSVPSGDPHVQLRAQ